LPSVDELTTVLVKPSASGDGASESASASESGVSKGGVSKGGTSGDGASKGGASGDGARGLVRIERIVSAGQVSGWYDQEEAEFVALLEGGAAIEYGDGSVMNLKKGDTLLIEPHVRHRVAFTSVNPPCIWLCVFYG